MRSIPTSTGSNILISMMLGEYKAVLILVILLLRGHHWLFCYLEVTSFLGLRVGCTCMHVIDHEQVFRMLRCLYI